MITKVIAFTIATIIGLGQMQLPYISTKYLSTEESELYFNTISQVLKDDLWSSRDMYDACHYLMVPMHFAFETRNEEYISEFSNMFERFEKDVILGDDNYEFNLSGTLNRTHFMYLISEFMLLCEIYEFENLYSDILFDYVSIYMQNLFLTSRGPWSSTNEFGIEERITNILEEKKYTLEFHNAITDLDTFPLAILCDLKTITNLRGEEPTYEMVRASELAYEIFSNDDIIVYTDVDGFVIQPGVWSTHPDALYAGNNNITEDIEPKIKEDYVSDTSHFHRIPLFLNSYMLSQDTKDGVQLFITLKEKLANQMINAVIKEVDGYLLCTTFMDGTNGVYRYSYNTEGIGLEGYALSGTFLLGWWSFLDDDRITEIYRDILENFPLPKNDENPYFDYSTTREQNYFFDADTHYYNGYVEMLVTLAGK